MPRSPIDYSKTSIYKFVCKDLNITDIYVGHTTCWKDRKRAHKKCWNNVNNKKYHLKIYQGIRENGGWDNWDMIEIEKYSCKDTNEAKARERYWVEFYGANLNMIIPNRTKKEYYKDTIEEQREKLRIYASNHREEKREYDKKRREEKKLKKYKEDKINIQV